MERHHRLRRARRLRRLTALSLLLVLAGNQQAQGQIQPDRDEPIVTGQATGAKGHPLQDQRVQCFRGRPWSQCRSFWITEAQFGYELVDTKNPSGEHGVTVDAEVGWMRNLRPRSAVGGGLAVGSRFRNLRDGLEFSNLGTFVSLRPRYRHWLTSSTGLDGVLGVRWMPGRVETVEARLALIHREMAGLWTEALFDLGTGRFSWSLGMKAGSYLGVALYTAALVWGAVVVLVFLPQAN